MILQRVGYTTSYNEQTKTPNWVAWHLTKAHTYGKNQRKQEVLKDRAREMGIYILEGVHRMDAAAFRNELRKLDDKTIHVR